tara:strand:+ start:69 stop:347 length:279 start_codon:yes stop_codon:yes gene_type:complete
MVKPNVTPATEDKNTAEKIMNGQEDIFNIYRKCTYDDLKMALQTWLNGGEEANSATTPTATQTATPTSTAKVPSDVTKTDNISAAFDDLFND